MKYSYDHMCKRDEWGDSFYKKVWEKAYKDAIPISGTFELTPRCNFSCCMCYVHLTKNQIANHGQELNANEWISIAKEAKEAGTTWLCITGGEPFMHPEFDVIWRELCQMGFFISLQTNASLINETNAKLLYDYPPRNVKITLYGSNDETYERVCKVQNGFSKVSAGIKQLQEMNIPIQLVTTIIRQNESDLQEIAFYAYEHNLPWNATCDIKGSCRGADTLAKEVRLNKRLNEIRRREISWRLETGALLKSGKPCTICRDYRLGYWVVWNGYMRFCSFMNEPNINMRNKTFKMAWKELLKFEENLEWPDDCQKCKLHEVCFKCAGMLAAECGSCHDVTAEFCQRIKKAYNENKGELEI